jgi:RHS repeat-associated protein
MTDSLDIGDTYTVLMGDTLTSIATGLKNAINADVSLQAIGVSATSSGAVVTLSSTSTNVTTYTESTSGGATETIALGVNTFGYLTKIDGPLSGSNDITTFSWDTVGRLASVTDSEGYQVQYGYDNADRLLLTTYPDATTEQMIYDRLDATLRKDRIGRWTQDAFDQLDQLSYEIDPLGRKTQYSWCVCGSLASLTDPNGNETTWQHDLQGRVVAKTYADTTTCNYVYEQDTSLLHSKTDALNQTTFYSYGPDNTPLQVSYRNAVNSTGFVTYAWDPNYRRLSSVLKSDWGTISYTYNAYDTPGGGAITGGGMLQKVHNNVIANSDVTYTYDSLGRTSNRSINGVSNSVGWTYDAMSRITQEVNALGTFGYSYVDNVSGSSKGTLRLSSISYPNSQTTNFSWYPTANDERLQQISNLNTSGGMLSQFNYQYDSAGEITQWQQQQNGSNLFYNLGYDAAGQLTSAQAGSGSPRWPYAKEFYYNYDPGANRTGVQQTSLQTLRIGGTKTTGNTLTVTVKDPALSGGQEAVTYTVLAADTLATIAAGLATAINTDSHLQALGVIANAHGTNTFINIRSVSSNNTTYSTSTSGGATETMTFGIFQNGTENATVAGTKTTGDVLTLTVHDAALAGGQEAVPYTVLAADTLTTIATGLKSAVNADAHLSALGVTATSAKTVVSINSISTNVTSYTESVSGGATETIGLTVNQNPTGICIVGGTVTTADVLKINVYDAGLAGGTEAISYTVGAGNTLTQIATGLTSAINADTNLQGIGVTATSSGPNITIVSNSTNPTTYRQTYGTSTTTESLSLTTPTYGWQVAAIGGTKTTSDVLKITVSDSALSTGTETVSYSVVAADTLTSIATNVAAAINADTNLSNIGVTASSSSTVVSIESVSPNLTTYTESVSSGATETIALGSSIGATQAAFNSVNELISTASGGAADFQGTTDKPVKSATVSSQVISISATPPVPSSFSASFTATPTETITITPFPNNDPGAVGAQSQYSITFGGTVTVGDTLSLTIYDVRLYSGSESLSYTTKSGDTTTTISDAFDSLVNNDTTLTNLEYNAAPTFNQLTVFTQDSYKQQVNNIALSDSIVGAATETVTLSNTSDLNVNATIGGTVHTGDVVSVTATNPDLTGGQETASYTVVGTDTTTTIATALTSAINADTHLQAIGVGASSSANVVSITTDTSYTASHSAGATETITLGTDSRGNCTATIGGKPTTSDTVTITAHNNALSGGQEVVTYTVLSTDTLQSIAAGLAAAMTADAHLQTLGVSAASGFPATLATTQNFSGKALLPTGASAASASAVDGSSNSKNNGYQLSVPTGTSTSLTYDLNGNMTSDGTNSYSWDAENRLIKIVYPGSGNNSAFTYDGFGRNVEIVETVSGSVTSTKQFVWSGSHRRETRNGTGTVTAQFFGRGEIISGTSYVYTKDKLRSIREMTNSTGAVQSQYDYDPFGRATLLQGSVAADFQLAGYYFHAPSGLSLTRNRAYSPRLGRFINRDPIGMRGGVNLYAYVGNTPMGATDPSGLLPITGPITMMPPGGGPPVVLTPEAPIPATPGNGAPLKGGVSKTEGPDDGGGECDCDCGDDDDDNGVNKNDSDTPQDTPEETGDDGGDNPPDDPKEDGGNEDNPKQPRKINKKDKGDKERGPIENIEDYYWKKLPPYIKEEFNSLLRRRGWTYALNWLNTRGYTYKPGPDDPEG